MPLLLVLKIIMSGCDAWTYSSHFGAIRGAHVEAKPSTEGAEQGERTWGPKTLLKLWIVSSPALVMCNIQFSHCFT